MALSQSEICREGVFRLFDHLQNLLELNGGILLLLQNEVGGVLHRVVVDDIVLDEGGDVVIEMLFEQSFRVELLGHFADDFPALVYHKVLVFVQEIAAEFDVETVGFPDKEEILRVVAIEAEEIDLGGEEGHRPADLVYLVPDLPDSLFGFGLLRRQFHYFLFVLVELFGHYPGHTVL